MLVRNEKDAPMSLPSLPKEILDLIFSFICPHCVDGPLADNFETETGVQGQETLKALLFTCKRLSATVSCFLYHNPCWVMSVEALIQALDKYPDLGRSVKELESPLFISPVSSDFRVYLEAARNLSLNVPERYRTDENQQGTLRQFLCAEVLLTLAPNAAAMRIQIRHHDQTWTQVFRYLVGRLRTHSQGERFECVRHLEISKGLEHGLSIANPAIPALLGPMRHLTHLRFCEVTGFSSFRHDFNIQNMAPSLQNLLVLEFKQSAFSDDDLEEDSEWGVLRQIIEHAPKLVEFKFNATITVYPDIVFHDVPPEAFVSVLLPRKATLRRLSLGFRDETTLPRLMGTALLGQFASLETLELDDMCFCRHSMGPREHQLPSSDETCIVNILPLTVKNLHITITERLLQQAWSELLHLAKQITRGKFPSLRHVEIRHCPADDEYEFTIDKDEIRHMMETLWTAFKDTGVAVKLCGPTFWLSRKDSYEVGRNDCLIFRPPSS